MRPRSGELPFGARPLTFGGKAISPLISRYGAPRFIRFFLARVLSDKDRKERARALAEFCHWADHRGHGLDELGPITVSIYLEILNLRLAVPAVKIHAEAIRVLFDWFIALGLVADNPVPSPLELDRIETDGLPAAREPKRNGGAIDIVTVNLAPSDHLTP